MSLEIIEVQKELRTDSRQLASFLDHRHRTILENIDKYSAELLELNPLPFQSEMGKPLPQGGFAKATRYALLTEDQCYFLLTLMRNNDKVVRAKLELVKAFKNARAQLAERDIARIDGKAIRLNETKAIQRLVDYATGAGSEHAHNYYASITKLTNKLVGIESGKRDALDAKTLAKIAQVEQVIDLAIRDGLKAKMSYKDIYKLAKMRAESVSVEVIGIVE